MEPFHENLTVTSKKGAFLLDYLYLFYVYFGLQMASYWGVDMRGMFHRNDIETLVDEEVSQFLIKDLPWEDNLLIRQADSFIPSSSRKRMIDWWAGKQGILEHQGIGKYEWTAKSKAPQPLQQFFN